MQGDPRTLGSRFKPKLSHPGAPRTELLFLRLQQCLLSLCESIYSSGTTVLSHWFSNFSSEELRALQVYGLF